MAQSHGETAKTLKSSVLPTFERLHTEIKNKAKELVKGAGKGSKIVEKARAVTQKHIELLGQHSASYDSTGGKVTAEQDPYLLYRGTMFRLNRQILEENSNRQDIIGVQNNFQSFESHVVQVIHTGLGQLNSVVSKQADIIKSLYGDMVATGQRIPPDFEWINFLHRNSGVLIDPEAPERTIENVTFPNMNHRATIPLISGTLERKGKLLRRWDTYYYAVSPSKFLHEFKTDDDFAKEPLPEMSLYLPDCVVGQCVGNEFGLKGKDASKGKLGIGVHSTHEFTFKAHTADDAERWWEIVRAAAGQVHQSPLVASPVVGHAAEGAAFGGAAAAAAGAIAHHESSPTQARPVPSPPATVPQHVAAHSPDELPVPQETYVRSQVGNEGLTEEQIAAQTAANTAANAASASTAHAATSSVAQSGAPPAYSGTIPLSHLPKSEVPGASTAQPPMPGAAGAAGPSGAGGVVTSAGPKEGVSTNVLGNKI
jgi:hypothetical protein